MAYQVKDGFSILLLTTNAVRDFSESLKLLRSADFSQEHLRTCLIINLLENPDMGITLINEAMDIEVAPIFMHFVRAFPLHL